MTKITDLQTQRAKSTSKDLAKMSPKNRIRTLMQDNQAEIAAALPRHVTPERMMQVALTSILTTPALLECNTASLFGALVKATQLGLEPNNALGHCYLIPFQNRKMNRVDAQLMIGYKGLLDLARRSGNIKSIAAYCVRQGDEFSYEYGLNEHLRHVPKADDDSFITHAYAYAVFKDGGSYFEVMSRDKIDGIMRSTQSGGRSGPWKSHYEEMARKTAIRRISKYLPLSIEAAEAVAIDAMSATGTPQNLDNVLSGDFSVPVIEATENASEPVVDTHGELFDADIHVSGKGGVPVYNKDGSFRMRPKRQSTPTQNDSDPQQGEAEEDGTEPESGDDYPLDLE